MPDLKDGIPLNQPTAKVHKANRRPLYIVGAMMIVLILCFIWAFVALRQKRATATAEQQAAAKGDPAPSLDAARDLEQRWNEKRKDQEMKGNPPAETRVSDTSATVPPLQHGNVPDLSTYQSHYVSRGSDSQYGQQQPQLTPEQQAAQQAAEEERAAIEAPLAPQTTGLTPQSHAPNETDPTAAILAAARNSANAPNSLDAVAKLLHGNNPPQQGYGEQNGQQEKQSYYREGKSNEPIVVPAGVPEPDNACIVHAGWDIPAILEQSVDSDLPGELRARVRANVYDSKTGTKVCIPQNSILLGDYNSNVGYAQNRVQVRWTTLEYPDNRPDVDLGNMPGLGADGKAGLGGQVDNHFKRLIGFAALSSLFAAGIEISQNRNASTLAYPSNSQVVGQAVGQQMGEFGQETIRPNMRRQPTIVAPAGSPFNVRVNRTIAIME